MLFLMSFLLNLVHASDQQETRPKLCNDCGAIQVMNETPYYLEINPDDISYRYFKDVDRQPVFWNIFDINFPGYEVESSDSQPVLQTLSDVASLTLTGESCNDLSLKILYLNKTEQVMQIKLMAVSSQSAIDSM